MQSKRVLLIIAFIVLIIALGALIYFVIGRDVFAPGNENENVNVPTNGALNGNLPSINGTGNMNRVNVANTNAPVNIPTLQNVNAGGVTPIAGGGETTATPAVSRSVKAAEPALSGKGMRYYDERRGKFYTIDENGNATEMSDKAFPEAEEIDWSPAQDKAIITFPDDSKIVYDFENETQVTLPKTWDDTEFDPTGTKIGFKNLSDDEGDRWLAYSKSDGSEVQLIEPIGDKERDVDVNWSPNGQVLALYRESNDATAQEVYPIGLFGENFKSVVTYGRGFEGTWSADGTQLLYSVFTSESDFQPVLYLVDSSGDMTGANHMRLGLRTWSTKCAFAKLENAAYCAVPQSLPEGSGLVPETATNTNDVMYRIDTNTGTSTVLAVPAFDDGQRDYTVSSVFLTADEKHLNFIDANTSNVYSIQIK
ncbi:MAG: hypothetical protein PHY34_02615 [Patescibacteria group bacterium]|nr:hypothetical protein [Patescibacteria group bacterium]MDD5715463.1 hypothetical protein [Patescibacteria group bacterium]